MRMWNNGRNDAVNQSSDIRCGCQNNANTGKANWHIETKTAISDVQSKIRFILAWAVCLSLEGVFAVANQNQNIQDVDLSEIAEEVNTDVSSLPVQKKIL